MRQMRRYAQLLPTLAPELKDALKLRLLQCARLCALSVHSVPVAPALLLQV
jgi:hypothetical protein